MRILIAEDDPVSRSLLQSLLTEWGHEVAACGDGISALQALQAPDAPKLSILDWQMPGMDGIDVCRRVRAAPAAQPPYLILLTVRQDKESIVAGLQAGANDFVTKPFDAEELRARITVGASMIDVQENLAARVRELEDAMTHIKRLQGILPICMYCKKICNDKKYWQPMECYVAEHSEARFSHGLCPECFEQAVREFKSDRSKASDASMPPTETRPPS